LQVFETKDGSFFRSIVRVGGNRHLLGRMQIKREIAGGYTGRRSCMISGTGSEEQQRTREQSSEDPYSNNRLTKHSRNRL
jgi:hypothetical protein